MRKKFTLRLTLTTITLQLKRLLVQGKARRGNPKLKRSTLSKISCEHSITLLVMTPEICLHVWVETFLGLISPLFMEKLRKVGNAHCSYGKNGHYTAHRAVVRSVSSY